MGDRTDGIACDGGKPPDSNTFRTRFDAYDEASFAVVRAVASILGEEPTDLPPLTTVVDPDGLARILMPSAGMGPPPDLTVSFTYEGCFVTVTRSGSIEVVPPEPDADGNPD